MKLVGLTDLEGHPLWIVPTWVEAIKRPTRIVYDSRANGVVIAGGQAYAVKETPEQIVQALKESDT